MIFGLYEVSTFEKGTKSLAPDLEHILAHTKTDILIFPEYSNISKTELYPLSTKNPDTLIVSGSLMYNVGNSNFVNRSYCMLNGQNLLLVDKSYLCERFSVGYSERMHMPIENVRRNSAIFAGKIETPHTFKFKDKLFGVEICRDNEYGVLGKSSKEYVDFQILVSCGNTGTANAIKDNGFFIWVDGDARDERRKPSVGIKKFFRGGKIAGELMLPVSSYCSRNLYGVLRKFEI